VVGDSLVIVVVEWLWWNGFAMRFRCFARQTPTETYFTFTYSFIAQ
jgi:hypothetical protein